MATVLALLLEDVMQSPYILTPEAYADQRIVSIKIDAPITEAKEQATSYMTALGYDVDQSGGIDTIRTAMAPIVPDQSFIYTPRHRAADYILDQVKPISSGQATADPNGSLIFYGSAADIERIRTAIPRLDVPVGEIEVLAAVYEVTSGAREGSAVELATAMLSSGIGIGIDIGAATPVASPLAVAGGAGGGAQGITIRTPDLTAVANILGSDSRFRLITKPSVRAQSGSPTRFTSGDTVPILGAVTYSESGAPIQSVEYKDSGVVFEVTPIVHAAQIDMKIQQELSTFSETTTGVNGTPTLNKRALSTTLSMQDGETVLLGGLIQHNTGSTQRSIFGFPLGDQASSTKTEVIIVLTARMIGSSRYAPPFNFFDDTIQTPPDDDLAAALAAIAGPQTPIPHFDIKNESAPLPVAVEPIQAEPQVIIVPADQLPPGQRPYIADRIGACGLAGLFSKC